jgi:hypothetical protein
MMGAEFRIDEVKCRGRYQQRAAQQDKAHFSASGPFKDHAPFDAHGKRQNER